MKHSTCSILLKLKEVVYNIIKIMIRSDVVEDIF